MYTVISDLPIHFQEYTKMFTGKLTCLSNVLFT